MERKITIIKKANRIRVKKQPHVSAKDLKRIKTREMSSTVSDWVSELRRGRGEETKRDSERLFKKNQPMI